MNLFTNMFQPQQNQNGNPQQMALQMIEGMKQSGKITQAQYDALMENKNDPQRMISTMLQNRMVTNDQYSYARNNVQSFFGIK